MVLIGGLGAGMSPPTFYGNLIRRRSDVGNVCIVAVKLFAIPYTDHLRLARTAAQQVSETLLSLRPQVGVNVPLIRMGHSLGSKLLLLTSVDNESREKRSTIIACVFISFNNSKLRQALPDMSGTISGLNYLINGLMSTTDRIPGLSIARDTIYSIMRPVKHTINS